MRSSQPIAGRAPTPSGLPDSTRYVSDGVRCLVMPTETWGKFHSWNSFPLATRVNCMRTNNKRISCLLPDEVDLLARVVMRCSSKMLQSDILKREELANSVLAGYAKGIRGEDSLIAHTLKDCSALLQGAPLPPGWDMGRVYEPANIGG